MEFVFGGVQKDFSCKHLFQNFTRSSWSLQNLITCDQSCFTYMHLSVLLVMWMYRLQYPRVRDL